MNESPRAGVGKLQPGGQSPIFVVLLKHSHAHSVKNCFGCFCDSMAELSRCSRQQI